MNGRACSTYKMFIDGEWQESETGKHREIINPCNGEVIARVAEGSRADSARSLAAARRAFDDGPWPQLAGEERGTLLHKLAKKITEEKAIHLANNTIYGLSAGFWTEDDERTVRVSKALRFGTVWINDFNVYFAQAPWGGFKQSGFGRELGRQGLEEYKEVKHIFRNHNPEPLSWFGVRE